MGKVARVTPGLAFSMPIDRRYLVGLLTHDIPRHGSLIWVATPTFEAQPTTDAVSRIESWRWPVFFPLAGAIRRHVVTPIGMVPIPQALKSFPIMRGGHSRIGWVAFTYVDGEEVLYGRTEDRSLPINHAVNDTALREMVTTNYRPEDEF